MQNSGRRVYRAQVRLTSRHYLEKGGPIESWQREPRLIGTFSGLNESDLESLMAITSDKLNAAPDDEYIYSVELVESNIPHNLLILDAIKEGLKNEGDTTIRMLIDTCMAFELAILKPSINPPKPAKTIEPKPRHQTWLLKSRVLRDQYNSGEVDPKIVKNAKNWFGRDWIKNAKADGKRWHERFDESERQELIELKSFFEQKWKS